MRSAVALALVATAMVVGCEEETSGLLDGGFEITYCTGFAWSLDEQGQVSSIDVRCARGAVCGTGLTYQSSAGAPNSTMRPARRCSSSMGSIRCRPKSFKPQPMSLPDTSPGLARMSPSPSG